MEDDEHGDRRSPLRGAVGVVGIVVGILWVVSLGSRGVHAGMLFELLPPIALLYLGVIYARRHLVVEEA